MKTKTTSTGKPGFVALSFAQKLYLTSQVIYGWDRREGFTIQLKATTGYSVRTMLYLYQKRGQVIASEELSRATGISSGYLHTVIGNLKGAGFVDTVRGAQGGYRIVEPADDVSLYDIIQITEPEKISCCLDNGSCSNKKYGYCAVSRFYQLAQDEWDRRLRVMTLKLLAANPDTNELVQVLQK